VDWTAITLISLATLLFLGVIRGIAGAYAVGHGEGIALAAAPSVRALAWLLNPLLAAQKAATRGSLKARIDEIIPDADAAASDFNLHLNPDSEPIDEREIRMIRGVLQLDKRIAREIMIPRVDMMTAEIGTSIPELAELMIAGGHSRIPIYRGDLDHLVGVAYARDVLRRLANHEDSPAMIVATGIRPALFIPESKTLGGLLSEFQEQRVHMAIVVDEYGGVSGLVTIEDLLEEIVGEIHDEFDVGDPEIEALDDNVFIMDARVSIDQLNELLRVSVEGDDFDTLGGFVYHRLGKIPSPGDAVQYDGLSIEVISTVGRRLKRLKVTRSAGRDSIPH
jgi:CBS domain containing-hemolysin-like protein